MKKDEGAALVLVLVFLALFGVLIAILLSFAETNFRTTTVLRERKARAYAADGGLEFAIQALRGDQYLACPNEGDPGVLNVPAGFKPNERSLTITCENLEGNIGFGPAAPSPAIVTTSGDTNSISTQSGGGAGPIIIKGTQNDEGIPAIYNAGGFDLKRDLEVQNGSVLQRAPCSPPTPPGGLIPSSAWSCTSQPIPDPYPDPPHGLPDPGSLPQGTFDAPGPDCRRFFPGTYKGTAQRPALTNYNYFVSGLYYFEDIGEWIIDKSGIQPHQVLGGKSFSGDEAQILTPAVLSNFPTACRTDPGASQDSFGVTFVLGGNSHITVKNLNTANTGVELFARYTSKGAPADPSIHAVRTTAPLGWKPSTADLVLHARTGSPKVAIHGLVYAYDGRIELFAGASGAVDQLLGGAVVEKLHLQGSASGSPPGVSSPAFIPDSGSRRLRIRASAEGAGETPVTFQGVIKVVNKTNPSDPLELTLESWRECRDPLVPEKC